MAFRGGYIFKNFEGTAEPVLRKLPVPEMVFISLSGGVCASFSSFVREGDTVRAGSKLLESGDGGKYTLAAPVNGTVTRLDDRGITITSDGTESFEPVEGHTRAPWHMGHEDLFDLMCFTGCQLLLERYFDSPEDCKSVKHIIINALHNGPLDQAWSPEVFGNAGVLSDGIKTLKSLFPQGETAIAVNKRTRDFFDASEITDNAAVCVLSYKYPQENPVLLSRDVIHRKLISDTGVPDRSIVILPYTHVIQFAEVMTQGRPLIDRILMIAGPGVSRPGWYRMRIGTTFDEIRRRLLKSNGEETWRIIRGNLFSGEGISSFESSISPTDTEVSVIREHAVRDLWRFMNPGFTFDSYPNVTMAKYIPILPKQLDSNVHGGVRPCVQCNYCDEVCPAGIYPHLIWKHVEAESVEESFRLRPFDCIGCGLCDYVCPSKISISSSVVKAKEEYHNSRRSDETSD